MRALSIHAGADTGGFGWNHAQAFKRYAQPGVTFRSIARSTNYLAYPHDLEWPHARQQWRRANVVHLHNTLRTASMFTSPKPVVLHHHGTNFRANAEPLAAQLAAIGGRAVVSTLDLLDYGDELTWIPQSHDLDALEQLRAPQTGRLRIGHAPTERGIKDTDAFMVACAKLNVEPVLIERKSWRECLAIKGTCDILYDQVILGYGNNAVEAWAMGIPVIAGAGVSTLKTMRDTFDTLPFLSATAGTIGDAIRALMDDDTRAEWGERGRTHAERWHNGRESVERLTAVYRHTLASHGQAAA